MLAVLTLFCFILTAWATEICPPTCQCLFNSSTLVCKEKQLQHIPTLPERTEELYMSYNQIQELPEQGLEALKVQNTTTYSITTDSNTLLFCLSKDVCKIYSGVFNCNNARCVFFLSGKPSRFWT